MDPINIIIGLNIIATFGANIGGAKKGLRAAVTEVREKPSTSLQKIPVTLATLTLVALILGIFQVGTLPYTGWEKSIRLAGLIIYLLFSWFQIYAYKSLGENYAQDVLIFKNHKLVNKGPYHLIRHPHYFAQIMMDFGGALGTVSYILAVLALIEIPFMVRRAFLEEKLLEKHFKDDFTDYKKKTGFMIPFIG